MLLQSRAQDDDDGEHEDQVRDGLEQLGHAHQHARRPSRRNSRRWRRRVTPIRVATAEANRPISKVARAPCTIIASDVAAERIGAEREGGSSRGHSSGWPTMRSGSVGNRSGASRATNATSSDHARRRPARRDCGRSGGGMQGARISGFLDARVEPHIDEVDRDVGRDHHQRAQHQDAQHHRVVARAHAVEQQRADARPAEHALDHHAAASTVPICTPRMVTTGSSALRSTWRDVTLLRRQALGARGAHEVELRHLQHRGAHHPGIDRGIEQAERQGRQHQVMQHVEHVGEHAWSAPMVPCRRPAASRASPRTARSS